jgi:hypothetical protein
VKQNIKYDEENDTLQYQEPVWYYFREDLSSGDLNDIVTVINVPLVVSSSYYYHNQVCDNR